MGAALLEVQDLHVHFISRDAHDHVRTARALNGVSFSVARGETLGLVGETGAGKSLTASAIMQLIRPPGRQVAGRILFDGADLGAMETESVRALRGSRIALVVQSPRTTLDPLQRVGAQIARVRRAHSNESSVEAHARAVRLLASVGIADAERRARAWPHELSGGMAQRVLIAMALVNDPELLIADEPTTGLDVTVQAQVLDLLQLKARERNAAAIIITHDLGVVAQYCDRVAVMFAGSIVEQGPVARVLDSPRHPYTAQLVASAPDRFDPAGKPLVSGEPPNLYALPAGCPFQPRCPHRQAACASPPPEIDLGEGHAARCIAPLAP